MASRNKLHEKRSNTMTNHYKHLDNIFDEITTVVLDLKSDDLFAAEIAKSIIGKYALCSEDRRYLIKRMSRELGIAINSL